MIRTAFESMFLFFALGGVPAAVSALLASGALWLSLRKRWLWYFGSVALLIAALVVYWMWQVDLVANSTRPTQIYAAAIRHGALFLLSAMIAVSFAIKVFPLIAAGNRRTKGFE